MLKHKSTSLIKCSNLVKEVLPPVFRKKTEEINDLLKIMQNPVMEINLDSKLSTLSSVIFLYGSL